MGGHTLGSWNLNPTDTRVGTLEKKGGPVRLASDRNQTRPKILARAHVTLGHMRGTFVLRKWPLESNVDHVTSLDQSDSRILTLYVSSLGTCLNSPFWEMQIH
jgi:hypothetical protein